MKFKEFVDSDEIALCEQNELNETSLSRVWRQTQKFDSGTITAYRGARDCGEGKPYTKEENKKRNSILRSKLLNLGYSLTKVKGTYIENYGSDNEKPVKEESFLVVDVNNSGKLKKDLMKLGEEFEQDSITYSKPSGEYYLIGTNKCPNGYPGYHKEIKLGKSMFGKKGEFYSRVNKRPFVFESIQNRLINIIDVTPTEVRSIKGLSQEKI